jgi:hypothetical protein
MSIAGHVSRAMLSRYPYVRMEANSRLCEIAVRPRGPTSAKNESEPPEGPRWGGDSVVAVGQDTGCSDADLEIQDRPH